MDKHVFNVCSAGFYQLRQLRCVRLSLDSESAAALVHAFVTSRIDYCNVLLAGAPKATTDKLQRLLNAAARLVSNTRKFDHHGRSLCMSTCIGWMCRSEWSTHSCQWCITASTTELLSCTWWTDAFPSPMWLVDNIFVPSVVITWLCRDTVSSYWLPGTHWVTTICVIQCLALTVSDGWWRLACF